MPLMSREANLLNVTPIPTGARARRGRAGPAPDRVRRRCRGRRRRRRHRSAGDALDTSVTGEVIVDGSSTVFPMSTTAAELMKAEGSPIEVSVGEAGTGGGFERFCADETDISNASRPIDSEDEVPVCEDAGIEYTEVLIATDALTVAVHPDLAVDCLTVDELTALFGPKSKATNWQDINPDFPDQDDLRLHPRHRLRHLRLHGFRRRSATTPRSRCATTSRPPRTTTSWSRASPAPRAAVGFFGYTYYEQNQDSLKAVAIDSGAGLRRAVRGDRSGRHLHAAGPAALHLREERVLHRQRGRQDVRRLLHRQPAESSPRARRSSRSTSEDYAATQDDRRRHRRLTRSKRTGSQRFR